MKAVASAVALRWPPERFYWAVLEGDAVKRGVGARQREQLGYLFEGYLPGIAIECVHAVYQHLADGRYVACGLPKAVLEEEVPREALSLCPEALPAFIDANVDPEQLNLLTGQYRPKALRRMDARWLTSLLVIVVACMALFVGGLERRTHSLRIEAGKLENEKMAALQDGLGDGTSRGPSSLPPEQQLIVERRRLEQTRRGQADIGPSFDAAMALADILTTWPADVIVETESVTVGANGVTVLARVPSMADAQALADSLKAVHGWRLLPFQSQARADQVEVTLRLEPERLAAGGQG